MLVIAGLVGLILVSGALFHRGYLRLPKLNITTEEAARLAEEERAKQKAEQMKRLAEEKRVKKIEEEKTKLEDDKEKVTNITNIYNISDNVINRSKIGDLKEKKK
jgi:hypothetical protein